MHVTVTRLGVHESVEAVFPPDRLAESLAERAPGSASEPAPAPATESGSNDGPSTVADFDVTVVDDAGIDDCDAVVTLEHRDAFCDLEWVHSIQAGIDRFPLETFEERGVVLTNSTGIHGRSVGETVAGYLLAFSRRLHDHVANRGERRWERPEWDEAFTLPGTTACVVGTGTLGRGVADVVGSLGVRTVGVRRSADPLPEFDEMYASDDLHAAVSDAAFVVVTVPLTDETEGLFGAEEFAAMRADARFVNVARGAVVDEPALIDALESGEIAGAALDVFATEPLPEESPLWGMDEVIVTPHCAAYTRDYYRDVAEIVLENLERLASGTDPAFRNRVV